MWALRNVSFDMPTGQSLGIIGHNGAGKSTLLKIASRITPPTEGVMRVRGRVGSLLEVGTGFHPELTGRENVYLNAAVLGMTKRDVRRRFDEIVEFAGVSRFLDTPIKRYSSGMYVRLAFAVAAHLEPEVLVVDEVLSVGDHEFQKKCLGKMSSVATEGRTVIFVSHNMAAVTTLCSRALLLKGGAIVDDGPSAKVVRSYVDSLTRGGAERSWDSREQAPGGDTIRLMRVCARSARTGSHDVDISDDVLVDIDSWCAVGGQKTGVSVHVKDEMGVVAFVGGSWWEDGTPGVFRTTCTIPGDLLNDGRYSLRVYALKGISSIEACVDDAVSFMVHDSGGSRSEYLGNMMGVVRPKLDWRTERLD